ncbi:MAG: prepilin-type N-terminal cleavage/methylation domain-containing protein [Nitrospiraceae bacterium]|nr:prepilin-type N-terminal cleavage/methylation domain-containing protein [Nitrospiraceae bacterium]
MKISGPGGGFTLLELLVVLLLISIVIAIVSVSMAPLMKSSKLDSTAQNISATMRYARALSAWKGRSESVLIDLDSRGFGIENRKMKYLGPDMGMKVTGAGGEDIESGVYKITFFPSGTVEGGSVIIWNDKKELKIEPDPVTGAAEPERAGGA